MKISESWLREWVNPDLDSEQLAHRLTMLGLEVDSVDPVAPPLDQVVVGLVLEVTQHPNADRLSVCKVDIGDAEPLSIVCGAANVTAGELYPAALVGAVLPGGLKIKKSKLRGESSSGMLCSAVELGIAESAEGILSLVTEAAPGTPIAEALNLDDQVIDIDLTPNRADCFSVLGVARDIAASEGLSFSEPEIAAVAAITGTTFPVELKEHAGCGRFVGRVIEDINPDAQTPLWMQERLRRSGVRPISPVVDVTNFVMLELGQPMHGYDLNKLSGGIVTRRASEGEQLELLGGQTVTLDSEVLVISDANGAVGIAGIMGGEGTAVSEGTTAVFLESAYFDRDVIAGRARRYGLHTDASVRFERGVDPQYQARAIERATALLIEITGGQPGPVIERSLDAAIPETKAVSLRAERLNRILGIEIPSVRVTELLEGLGMTVEQTKTGWSAIAPSARFDIEIESDLIEEVVRLYGYDQIPAIPGAAPVVLGEATEASVPLERLRSAIIGRGYQEAITYSFVDADYDAAFSGGQSGLALSNPISSELSVMRQSLWPGLVGALKRNLSRQHSRVRLFESGVRFVLQDDVLKEENVLSGVAYGDVLPEQWSTVGQSTDLFDIKADLLSLFALTGNGNTFDFSAGEHPALRPGRTALISRDGQPIGWLGELHPALVKKTGLAAAPILFELLMAPMLASRVTQFAEVSKFPAVRRDIAVVVQESLPVAEIEKVVSESAGSTLRDVVVFDIYAGTNIDSGSKSVALGLILQETSRTLNDADVDKIIHTVTDRLSSEFNATIRE